MKHKVRNNVIVGADNGGGEHWLEGVEIRAPRSWDMHQLGKFHAMLATDSTCLVRSKGQMEGYGPLVNHIRPHMLEWIRMKLSLIPLQSTSTHVD